MKIITNNHSSQSFSKTEISNYLAGIFVIGLSVEW